MLTAKCARELKIGDVLSLPAELSGHKVVSLSYSDRNMIAGGMHDKAAMALKIGTDRGEYLIHPGSFVSTTSG